MAVTGRGWLGVLVLLVASCAGAEDDESAGSTTTVADTASTSGEQATSDTHPSVIGVEVTASGDGTYRFAVTISSPYDSPERYADAWRVRSAEGEEQVYAVRDLTHDHAAEQPFTRTLSGVAVPADVTTVVVEGRDLVNGWGGATMTVELPQPGE